MATKADLFNLAIGYLGEVTQDRIDDPDSQTNADARRCSHFYQTTLESFLNEYHWSWAKKYRPLSLSATTTEENGVSFLFAYFWPSDCVDPYWLTVAGSSSNTARFSTTERVPYEVAIDINDQQVIYTDLENAVLRYTTRLENFNKWPGSAFDALAMKLAVAMAPSKTGGTKFLQLMQLLEIMLDKAKVDSQTMEQPEERPSNDLLDARHGWPSGGRHHGRHH